MSPHTSRRSAPPAPPLVDTGWALLVDQTGCRPVALDAALGALHGDGPSVAAVAPSPEHGHPVTGPRRLVACVGDPVDGMAPVVTIHRPARQPGLPARVYAVRGPVVIVARDLGTGPTPTATTRPLTVREVLHVLRTLYRDDRAEVEHDAVCWLLDWSAPEAT